MTVNLEPVIIRYGNPVNAAMAFLTIKEMRMFNGTGFRLTSGKGTDKFLAFTF